MKEHEPRLPTDSLMQWAIATVAGPGVAMVCGLPLLAGAFLINHEVTSRMSSDIGDGAVAVLSVLAIASVLAIGGASVLASWAVAQRLRGSPLVALSVTLPLLGVAAWLALSFMTFDNCCSFSRSFPIGGDCNC